MLRLLRTMPKFGGGGRSNPGQDLLGILWGAGAIEVFRRDGAGVRGWRLPEAIQDATRLRGAIEASLRHLDAAPRKAVVVLLHPEFVQIQVEVPAAAPPSVVRTLIRRSLEQQMPVKGPVRWRDVSLASSGATARRLVYAMSEALYQSIRETLGGLGIEMCSLIPFSGLALLEAATEGCPGGDLLEAWHLPCGLAIGLRRGGDLWMVRPLVLDPGDVRRISRELRQTLGFAREHWAVTAPRIRLRGPEAWSRAVIDALRSEGSGQDPIEAQGHEDWRSVVLRSATGCGVDLVPVSTEEIRSGSTRLPMASRRAIGVALPGLLVVLGLMVAGHRVRVRTLAMQRERQVLERTLEEVEMWIAQRDQARTLLRPWRQMPVGIPGLDLATWILDGMPEGLVLTGLDLGSTEAGWRLALSGRSTGPDTVAAMEALDAALDQAIGNHTGAVASTATASNPAQTSWAELLSRESAGSDPGDPAEFRREWILP